MIQSMTAFARVQTQLEGIQFCWEVKSVNHRYLDVSFRLPEAWRFLETELRACLRDKVHRGKLECQLKVQEHIRSALTIDEPLVDHLIQITNQLAIDKKIPNDISLSTLLNWPQVVKIDQPQVEQLAPQAINAFNIAIEQLIAARIVEGEATYRYLSQHAQRLQAEIAAARQLASSNSMAVRDKLLDRLKALQLDVDNVRIEQEIALGVTKLDITEELERLETHNQQVIATLNEKHPVGRKLDFLMQELNREANTLTSKSESIALTQHAVEMKVIIEQMREQIQNIE